MNIYLMLFGYRFFAVAIAAIFLQLPLALKAAAETQAQEEPQVIDYIHKDSISNVRLSRSGRYLAMISRRDGEEWIMIKDFETGEERSVETRKNNDLTGFISFGGTDETLFYRQSFRNRGSDMFIYNIAKRSFVMPKYTVANSLINAWPEFEDLTDVWPSNPFKLIAESDFNNRLSTYHYDVKKNRMSFVNRGPLNSVALFHDQTTGLPRVAITSERSIGKRRLSKGRRGVELAYFLPEKDSTWERLPFFDNDFSSYKKIYDSKCIVDLSPDGKIVYFTDTTEHGTRGLFSYDLDTHEVVEVASNPKYDLFSIGFEPGEDGTLYFSDKNGTLIGFNDNSVIPKMVWVDAHFASIQKSLDSYLPKGFINVIADWDFDETKFIVLAYNDVEFGNYYVFDTEKKSLVPLGKKRPKVGKTFCGKQIGLLIPLRDGKEMMVFLRFPAGVDVAKNLPTVVMFPGDLYSKNSWGNYPADQLLAKNGYAVLDLNPRGTSGYGREYFEEGLIDGGRRIVEDLEDALSYLIKAGTIDPDRLCLQGRYLSSYFCLQTLAENPDLFRSSIIINPISDYADFYTEFKRRYESRKRWSIFETALEGNDESLKDIFDINSIVNPNVS